MERFKTRYWEYMFMAFHGNSHGMRRLGRETLPGKALVHSDRLNFHLPSLAVNHLKEKWANAMCYSSRIAHVSMSS